MSHHPTCKPDDKTLGFLCAKCGTFEPCEYKETQMNTAERRAAFATAIANESNRSGIQMNDDQQALAALRDLQANGFDPLAAARDYPRLEAENARLKAALGRYVNDGTTQARYEAAALLNELGEAS